jgi:Enoyl-(Acyl carrier protein) reductase
VSISVDRRCAIFLAASANARMEAPTFYQEPMEITLDKWDSAVDSQAKAFLVGVREAARLTREGGRIIAITFAPGGRFGSWQPWVAMGAAKAAMEVLTRYFAVALAGRGNGEHDQSRLDRGQRSEQLTRCGSGRNPRLAQGWVDSHGSLGDFCGCGERGGAALMKRTG